MVGNLEKMKTEKMYSIKPIIFALIFQFLFFAVHIVMGSWAHSTPLELNSYFFFMTCGFWFFALLHTFFKNKAIEEKNEILRIETLRKERGVKSALFQNNEVSNSSFQQNFIKFEKYILPISSFLLAVIVLGFAYQYFKEYKYLSVLEAPIHIVKASGFLAGIAFMLLLFGLYMRSLAENGQFYLRGPSTMMLASSALVMLEVAGLVAFISGWLENLNLLYLIGISLFVVAGCELILNTFLYLYKPSHAQASRIPPYDSRIFLLLTSTGSAWKSLNAMVDYQFGFQVSETWLYKTLLKLVAPFIVFQVLIGVLCTSFVMIPAGHVGVIENFGKPVNLTTPWQPGFHFKLPWPLATVTKINVQEIKTIQIGHKQDDHDSLEASQKEALNHYDETDLFAVKHKVINQEDTYLELISITAIMQYRINEKGLQDYLYQYHSIEVALKTYLNAELSLFLSEKTIDRNLASISAQWGQEFRQSLTNKLAILAPGVEVTYMSLQNIHVPAELSEMVNERFINREKQKTLVLNAKADALKLDVFAQNEVAILQNAGFQEIKTSVLETKEEALCIQNLTDLFNQSKQIYKQREIFELIENYLAKAKIDFVPSELKLLLQDAKKAPNALESFKE